MEQKLAIIIPGGGMLAGYSSGLLYTLITKYKLKNPDIYLGGSAGAVISCYGVAQQLEEGKNIWYNRLCDKKCINSKRFWKIFDVDYLIDKIVLEQEELNIKKIQNSEIEIFISAIDRESGKMKYFSSKNCKNLPLILKGSVAIPFAFPKNINIDGKNYEDGVNSVNANLKIQKAIEEGANKIIVLDSMARTPKWVTSLFCF